MPELPEVETARRRAERALGGRRIAGVAVVRDPIVYEGVSPARFAATLRGRRVLAVHRKGKHLWMELDRPPHPLFHFGMTGSFEVYRAGAARPRFWKVEIAAEDGMRLAMADPRRLGRLRLRREPEAEPPLAGLGFDVLRGLPPAPELARLLARRGAPAKAVLLDQSLFAGVGNWIADEALYQAAIDPRRPASSLALPEVARLRSRLLAIVRLAVAVGADDRRYPRTWLFHRRWGRKAGARTARGEPIVHVTIGGRTTAVVSARYPAKRQSHAFRGVSGHAAGR
jgi:formamidopyrimidine-DNA glycosylase